jgi:beta-galactosidase
VAIVYDWENVWALNDSQGLRRGDKGCLDDCKEHYRAFWVRGIPVDIVDMEQELSRYKLVVAPMLYMVRPGVAERIAGFVESGGAFVTTYWSGIVDQNDLCFLGGFPGPLRETLGIWAEEIDALYPGDTNGVVPAAGNALGLSGTYEARELCDLIHAETAEVLATYAGDFYAGRPALTVNRVGEGEAYYVASRNEAAFLDDLYGALSARLGVRRSLDVGLPAGVSASVRTDGEREYVFLMNFNAQAVNVDLGDAAYKDLLTGASIGGQVELEVYGVMVLAR